MNNPGNHEFETLYRNWRKAVRAMPDYSKTTAYTVLPEFRAIARQGPEIVSYLEKKVREGEDMDFILSVAIVRIKGWEADPAFSTSDMTEYTKSVLDRLAAEAGHPPGGK